MNKLPTWEELWDKHAHTITSNEYTVMQTWDFKEAYRDLVDFFQRDAGKEE